LYVALSNAAVNPSCPGWFVGGVVVVVVVVDDDVVVVELVVLDGGTLDVDVAVTVVGAPAVDVTVVVSDGDVTVVPVGASSAAAIPARTVVNATANTPDPAAIRRARVCDKLEPLPWSTSPAAIGHTAGLPAQSPRPHPPLHP
jgi:hypothetical protein